MKLPYKNPPFPFLIFIFFLLLVFLHLGVQRGSAQVNPCSPNVPSYTVDLTGNPSATWISSPPVVRAGECCGSQWPDRCVVFLITLDTATIAINFNIVSGAMPSGAMYYQIDCSSPTPVGQPICLNGPGPYAITFCKPGSNMNTYGITAIGEPTASPGDTVGVGCSAVLSTTGLNPSTVTWTSVYPGANGAYNSYLNCTSGCTSVTVTPQPGAPAYVDYKVCGQSIVPTCLANASFCDTVRVYFYPLLTASVTPNPATFCMSSGGIALSGTVTGGDGDYNYVWEDINGTVLSTDSDYFVTASGTYIFEVTDGQYPECPARYDTVVVTSQDAPYVSAGADFSLCAGGYATLSGTVSGASGAIWTGGTGLYNPNYYSLNTTYYPSAAEVAAGSVTLTLTSTGNGVCPPATDQVVIFIKQPLAVNITGPPIICYGTTTLLNVVITGGTAPYSYIWSTGGVSPSIIASPGNYSVTVTDASSGICTANDFFTVLENPPLALSVSNDTSINCELTTYISAYPSGGNNIYSYFWSTGQTSKTITVIPGTYNVTVTDGAGCTVTGTVNVSGIGSALAASIAQPQNLCYGGTVPITVIAVGGTGTYTYQWGTGSTSQTIIVSAGTYCATVTDGSGCNTTACVTVQQDSYMSVTITNPSPVCNGITDTVTAIPAGGQPPYTFLWSTGQITQGIVQPSGTYSVTVTSANTNGCSASSSVTIFNEPNFNIYVNGSDVSCFNGNDGYATVFTTGGIPPYTYSWLPTGTNGSIASNLAAGTYTVVVNDNIGCTQTGSVAITQPQVLLVSVSSITNVSCYGGNNGSATVAVSGGTLPYNYLWSPWGGVSSTATGLTAGTYSVSVMDAEGCTKTVSVAITMPSALSVTVTGTNPDCYGGSNGAAIASVSGGTASYNYLWSSGGTNQSTGNLTQGSFAVTVTDSKGCTITGSVNLSQPAALNVTVVSTISASCNGSSDGAATASAGGGTAPYSYLWSSGAISATTTGLSAGIYGVTATDENGCTASSGAQITEPATLLALASPDQNIACNDTVTLASYPTGGTPAYSYLWSNGAAGQSILSVTPGTYMVTVTDAKNCTAVDTVEVTAYNSNLGAALSGQTIICNSGTTIITAIPSGGVAPYTFLWSNGVTNSNNQIGTGIGCVTVTDNTGCNVTSCADINPEPVLAVTAAPLAACFGMPQTITASASGGIPPYDYAWSTGDSTQSIYQIPGTYSVTVTDFISCTVSLSVNITQSPILTVSFINIYNISCKGNNDGSVTASPTGGNPPYSYNWLPVASSGDALYNLTPGTYSVTVTDAIGCTGTGNVTITEPASSLVVDSVSGKNVSCYGGSDGFASVNASGGVPPYNYLWWFDGVTAPADSNLAAGSYSVSAGDTNGCTAVATLILTSPPQLAVNLTSLNNVSCYGGNNGIASVTASGGTPPYDYLWSNNDSLQTISGLSSGNYFVTVTDANGCTIQSSALFITQPSVLQAMPTVINPACSNSTGSIILNVAGGTPVYSYNWSNGATAVILSGLGAGIYVVTVTDAMGCTLVSDTVITQPTVIAPVVSGDVAICLGDSTILTISASGGTPPYSFIWDNNLGAGSVKTVSPSSTTTYTAVVLDSNNCTSSFQTVTVTVNGPLTLSVPGTITLCKGDNTIITATAGGGDGGPYMYLWSNGFAGNSTPVSPLVTTTYYVTVTDNCGTPPVTDSVKVIIKPEIVLNPPSVIGCPGDTFTLAASGASYFWWATSTAPADTIGTSSVLNVYTSSTTYYIVHGYDGICKSEDTVAVMILPPPEAGFYADPETTTLLNPNITFTDNSSSDVIAFLWDFGDGTSDTVQNVVHKYYSTGYFTVQLIVTNQSGCSDTATKIIWIQNEFMLFMPAAFSPNWDGKNDFLFPKFIGVDENNYHFYIYDRWGDMIFESSDINKFWDGHANKGKEMAQQDVYIWLIEAGDLDGNNHTFTGHVTLLK